MNSPDNLFVYGTLMSTAASNLGKAERQRLKHEATSLGPAAVQGRLFDLGGYPGVVLADGADWVQGELMTLHNPEAAFGWLDPYEDVSTVPNPDDLYRRVLTVAQYGNCRVHCWIYELRSRDGGHKALPEGRWPQSRG